MMKKFLTGAAICFLSSGVAFGEGTLYFAPTVVLTADTTDKANYSGLSPRLTLGYGAQLNPYFALAGEIFGAPIAVDVKNNKDPGAYSLKTSWDYGASILPALNLNSEVMGYLRFGGIESHFHSNRTTTPGLQMGLGLQAQVSEDFDVRGEYIYTSYRSENYIGAVKADSYTIGFVKKFNL